MKLFTSFQLKCLLLQYETKDDIEIENNKVVKRDCLDLFHNSIEVGKERLIRCSNGSVQHLEDNDENSNFNDKRWVTSLEDT